MLARIVFAFGALMAIAVVGMLALSKLPAPSEMPEVAETFQPPVAPTVEIGAPASAQTSTNPINGLATLAQDALSSAKQQAATEVMQDRRQNTASRAQALLAEQSTTRRNASAVLPANYYGTWSDLIARCWDSVSKNIPFADTGLVAMSSEGSTQDGFQRQKWRTEDYVFVVTYTTEAARYTAPSGLDRTCMIKTSRKPFAASDVQALKGHYDAWFAAERLEASSVFQPYRWELRKGDQYHAAQTTFGSAQGCPMYFSYRDIVFSSDTEANFFLTEVTDDTCNASSGAGMSGVRVNRLPQITP